MTCARCQNSRDACKCKPAFAVSCCNIQLVGLAAAVKQAAHAQDCQELKCFDTKLQQLGRTETQNLGTQAEQAYTMHNNQLISMTKGFPIDTGDSGPV